VRWNSDWHSSDRGRDHDLGEANICRQVGGLAGHSIKELKLCLCRIERTLPSKLRFVSRLVEVSLPWEKFDLPDVEGIVDKPMMPSFSPPRSYQFASYFCACSRFATGCSWFLQNNSLASQSCIVPMLEAVVERTARSAARGMPHVVLHHRLLLPPCSRDLESSSRESEKKPLHVSLVRIQSPFNRERQPSNPGNTYLIGRM
jgi:hypothetical protein